MHVLYKKSCLMDTLIYIHYMFTACLLGDAEAYRVLSSWIDEDIKKPVPSSSLRPPLDRRLFMLVKGSTHPEERLRIIEFLSIMLTDKNEAFHSALQQKDDIGQSILLLACRNGLHRVVGYLLGQCLNVDKLICSTKPTLLWDAVNGGHKEVVLILMGHLSQVKDRDHTAPDGTTPLLLAVIKNNGTLEPLKRILSDAQERLDELLVRFGCKAQLETLKVNPDSIQRLLEVAVLSENEKAVETLINAITRDALEDALIVAPLMRTITDDARDNTEPLSKLLDLVALSEKEKERSSSGIKKIMEDTISEALNDAPKTNNLKILSMLKRGSEQRTSYLTEISYTYPRYNDIVERTSSHGIPLSHFKKGIKISIKDHLEKDVLDPFCPVKKVRKRTSKKSPLAIGRVDPSDAECEPGCKQ